ncbi:MAG: hypothetical protein WAO20_09885 [Acidobacteriota bacterium]
MKSIRLSMLALVLGVLALLAFAQVSAQNSSRELRVKLTYSGPGQVDAAHGIHLYVFDTPDISTGSMPIAMDSARENGAVLVVPGLTQEKVYLVAAYGDYDTMMGPPPSGTPIALYKPGDVNMPTPIAMDKDKVEVEFQFDDSMKMP